MSQKYNEAVELVTKYGSWFLYVMVGLIGKFGWDILNNRKLSGWYIFGTGCIAIFVGFITSKWCMSYNPASGAYVVPVATLISRDIMLFVTMIDWQGVLKLVTRKGTKN